MTSDRQCLALLTGWISAVCLWVLFSPGLIWLIERLAYARIG
jgi:hypothetical protein